MDFCKVLNWVGALATAATTVMAVVCLMSTPNVWWWFLISKSINSQCFSSKLWFVSLRSHKPYDIALCNHIIHRLMNILSVTDCKNGRQTNIMQRRWLFEKRKKKLISRPLPDLLCDIERTVQRRWAIECRCCCGCCCCWSECIFSFPLYFWNATALRFNSIESVMHCYVHPSCWHQTIGRIIDYPNRSFVSAFVGYATRISTTCFHILLFRFTIFGQQQNHKLFEALISYTIYPRWLDSFFFSFLRSLCLFSFISFDLLPFEMRCHCFSRLSMLRICASILFGHWTCHIIYTFSNNSSILLFFRAFVHFTILKYQHRHDCCLFLLYLMPRPP